MSLTISADSGDEKGLNINNINNILLIDSQKEEWKSSGPSAKVERKRFFRNGPPESGKKMREKKKEKKEEKKEKKKIKKKGGKEKEEKKEENCVCPFEWIRRVK